MRAAARASLSGKWGGAVMVTLVYLAVMGVLPAGIDLKVYDGVGSIIQLVLMPLGWSMSVLFLDNLRSGDEYKVGQVIRGVSRLHPCGRDDDTHRYLYVSLDLVAYRAGHHQVFFLCHDGFCLAG